MTGEPLCRPSIYLASVGMVCQVRVVGLWKRWRLPRLPCTGQKGKSNRRKGSSRARMIMQIIHDSTHVMIARAIDSPRGVTT